MKEFTFDIKLFAAITVKAETEKEAFEMLLEHTECADCNLGTWPDGTPILAEASVERDEIELVEV
jgi:hypothetical protein